MFTKQWSLVYTLLSIVDDMDEPTSKLIGRHNYCTQVLAAPTHNKMHA